MTTHDATVAPAITEAEYYSRQTRLAELGEAGQAKLRAARLLIVGAGGLGSPSLSYLAAAGVGTLGICEADRLEASNLHRQTLFSHRDVGRPKAELAAERLRDQNPFIEVRIHPEGITPENALGLMNEYDLVLDCTDNFPTKFLINDAAVITRTPAVFASIYQYEGQLLFVAPEAGTACLRCLWPEMPEPGCVGSCAEVGVLGAVPGMLGTMQAIEALKYLLQLREPLHSAMIILDCLAYTSQKVRIPRDGACPVCGASPSITDIRRERYLPPLDLHVDVLALDDADLAAYRIIDIREADEVAAQPLEGVNHQHMALSGWDLDHPPIAADEKCLLSCAAGARSLRLAESLQKKGYANVFSANGGWSAFHRRANAK